MINEDLLSQNIQRFNIDETRKEFKRIYGKLEIKKENYQVIIE